MTLIARLCLDAAAWAGGLLDWYARSDAGYPLPECTTCPFPARPGLAGRCEACCRTEQVPA